jgi:prepilin-type N-terminal cleavage/methylation domain-containing protein
MKRSAFTLIELLVVIAIIAILAAILFPVFAQAKAAAKAAASLSNDKQLGTASFMYSADYDDMLVLGIAWGASGAPVSYGRNYSPWGWLMLPYVKSIDIYQDPLAPSGEVWNFAGIQRGIEKVIESQYGYNTAYLSPSIFDPSLGYQFQGRSQTNGADVSNTVMFTSKFSTSEDNLGPSFMTWYSSGDGVSTNMMVDPPTCKIDLRPDPAGQFTGCWDNWGVGGSRFPAMLKQVATAGAFTGGVSGRAANNSIVLWLDGHASKKSFGALSNGTNWTPTQTAAAMVTNDKSKSMWSLTKQ